MSITSYPIRDLSVQIYETEASADGKFVQRFVPPGQIHAARSFKTDRGSSVVFPEHTLTLRPGERKLVRFGPLTEEMKASLGRVPQLRRLAQGTAEAAATWSNQDIANHMRLFDACRSLLETLV